LAVVPTFFIQALGATAIRFRVIEEAAKVYYNDTTASRMSKPKGVPPVANRLCLDRCVKAVGIPYVEAQKPRAG